MKPVCALVLAAALAPAAEVAAVRFHASAFDPAAPPAGWRVWAPRPEIAPRTFVEAIESLGEPGSLAASGNSNPGVFGGWEHKIGGIRAGRWYRLVAHYRALSTPYERNQILARIDWQKTNGKHAGQANNGWQVAAQGDWKRVTLEAPLPPQLEAVLAALL